jgi:hypothetical protein
MSLVTPVLIDARNHREWLPLLKAEIREADFIGFDYETEDSRRHAGINEFCGYKPDGTKGEKTKTVFDFKRTTICGASFYTELDRAKDRAYYLNFGHADVENRLSNDVLLELLATKQDEAYWVAHNAPFEQLVTMSCLGARLEGLICTLQMAVSAYGPDQYAHQSWLGSGQGELAKLLPAIIEKSITGLKDPDKMEFSPELQDLVFKVIAKTADGAMSWNGWAKDLSYGYGLKKAVKSHFNFQMTTFHETLNGHAHMGQLTGDETTAYGADDAYWAIRMFRHLMTFMMGNGGAPLVQTFFEQENPMVDAYAGIGHGGLRIDSKAVEGRLHTERDSIAPILVEMKAAVRELLPFPAEPNETLLQYETKWYPKNWAKYREQIAVWANSPDEVDPYEQAMQVRGPVSNGWAKERGQRESQGPNFSHYMPVRVLMYDLMKGKPIKSKGKLESDGEARGKYKDRVKNCEHSQTILDKLADIASLEQRMKLYIKPYMLLIDPETQRMYPTVSSMLATRRMACQTPNAQQLAKRGTSVFIRGFFLADQDDHMIVSLDWSAIELLLIGDASQDPEFLKAYGQLPHADLHVGSAASMLEVDCPGFQESFLKEMKALDTWEQASWLKDIENPYRLQHTLKGVLLEPRKAYSYWRTTSGKEANFSYWFSGYLAVMGERLGWGPDKINAGTQRYRDRFHVAERWRTDLIQEVAEYGFVTLPDGHRYNRYEATADWYHEWCDKFLLRSFGAENFDRIMKFMGSKIARRGGNQTVNARIQGTNATIAKRSAIRILKMLVERGWDERIARFMVPIHDELVFSVHQDYVLPFIKGAHAIMCDHPEIVQHCKLDSSPSLGFTFEPWHPKSPRGQIELYEPDALVVGKELAGKRLDDDGILLALDYAKTQRDLYIRGKAS